MLHTLNKAWTNIIANQLKKGLISNVLFVPKDEEKLLNFIEEKDCYIPAPYSICTEEEILYFMKNKPDDYLSMFDDILISHDIHDPLIKSYLSRHCRRKGA